MRAVACALRVSGPSDTGSPTSCVASVKWESIGTVCCKGYQASIGSAHRIGVPCQSEPPLAKPGRIDAQQQLRTQMGLHS